MLDHDLTQLRDHHVIVVNNSCFTYPTADFLVFADERWWKKWRKQIMEWFHGDVVAVTPMPKSGDYFLMNRQRTSGLSSSNGALAVWHTSATAAINLAVHLGVKEINLVGLDGQARGNQHWHHEPHPWQSNINRYKFHGEALEFVARDLQKLGVATYNVNFDSAHKMFPFRSFEDACA